MAGNKVFRMFLAAVHEQVGSWKPKAEFCFKSSWPTLISQCTDAVKKKKKGISADIDWKLPSPVVVFQCKKDIHEIRLEEYGLLKYFKCGSGKDVEEKFDTGVFEESVRIAWNLKEREESEDIVRDLKRLILLCIMNGKKKSSSELREIANCEQILKKALKELEKENDARVDAIIKENNRKKKIKKAWAKKIRKGEVKPEDVEVGAEDEDDDDDDDEEGTGDDVDGDDGVDDEGTGDGLIQ